MSEVIEESKYEISNSCECRFCEGCGMGTESMKCDECQQDTTETSYCDGFCYDYKRDWFENDVERWLIANNNPARVTIAGKHIGWQRLHGYATVNADHRDIFNALTFNGDWKLAVEVTGEKFIIVRYSHDEPMGASFWLVPALNEEDSE